MTETAWEPRSKGIIEVLPDEIDDFEQQVKRFRAGGVERDGLHGLPPAAGDLRAASAGRPDVPGEGALRRADRRPAGRPGRGGREVRAPAQGPRDHQGELPVPPHQAGGDGGGDARPGRRGAGIQGGVRNTVRNVTGCPQAGVCADEALRRDALRGSLLPLLRSAPVHPGAAAQVQDGLLRLRAGLRHHLHPRHGVHSPRRGGQARVQDGHRGRGPPSWPGSRRRCTSSCRWRST